MGAGLNAAGKRAAIAIAKEAGKGLLIGFVFAFAYQVSFLQFM
jgi:hypothetical protein